MPGKIRKMTIKLRPTLVYSRSLAQPAQRPPMRMRRDQLPALVCAVHPGVEVHPRATAAAADAIAQHRDEVNRPLRRMPFEDGHERVASRLRQVVQHERLV